MLTLLRPALLLWCGFTLLLGLVYPLSMTGLAQLLFPAQDNGSLVYHNGQVVGSQLIGQSFTAPNYFWGRLSAVSYDGASSGGTNFGPLNPALLKQVDDRIDELGAKSGEAAVPVDLVTASGSGLDPQISPEAAYYQVSRVAKARNLPEAKVKDLVTAHIEQPTLGVLGEPVVNVLLLNLDLDSLHE